MAFHSLMSVAPKVNFGGGLWAVSRMTGDIGWEVEAGFLTGDNFSREVLKSLSEQ